MFFYFWVLIFVSYAVSLNTESINSNINQEAIDHQVFIDEETSELKRHGEAFELKREEPFSVNAADMNGMV